MLKIGEEFKEVIKNEILEEKNILTATCSNVTYNTNLFQPTLILSNSIGNKLSVVDGKVKIGAGVSKVLISAGTFLDTANAGDYLWFFIRKNNSAIASILVSGGMIYKSCGIPPKLIDVKENDLINLYYDNTAGFPATIRGGNQTWLTVEVVE